MRKEQKINKNKIKNNRRNQTARPLPNNEIQEKQQVYVKQYPKCESVKQNKGIIREPDASRAKNKTKIQDSRHMA